MIDGISLRPWNKTSGVQNLAENVLVGVAIEGQAGGEQNKHDDSRRPQVARLVIILVPHLVTFQIDGHLRHE